MIIELGVQRSHPFCVDTSNGCRLRCVQFSDLLSKVSFRPGGEDTKRREEFAIFHHRPFPVLETSASSSPHKLYVLLPTTGTPSLKQASCLSVVNRAVTMDTERRRETNEDGRPAQRQGVSTERYTWRDA